MPNNIIMADPKGGNPYEVARKLVDKTITEYVDNELTFIGQSAFRKCTALTKLICPNVVRTDGAIIEGCSNLKSLAFPSLVALGTLGSNNVEKLDFGESFSLIPSNSLVTMSLQDLILRKKIGVVGTSATAMNGTPMKNGGAGCTVYIPKVLYDHLGDGTALDYKASSSWAPYDGYGTITWAKIEGSIYENAYADGTPIQTGG